MNIVKDRRKSRLGVATNYHHPNLYHYPGKLEKETLAGGSLVWFGRPGTLDNSPSSENYASVTYATSREVKLLLRLVKLIS